MYKKLEKHRNSVDLEDAYAPDLLDLARVKQFHLACVLIEVVSQGDAVAHIMRIEQLLYPPGLLHGQARGLDHLMKE